MIKIYKFSKFFVSLFIIYILWFYGAYGPYNIFLYGFAILSTIFVCLDAILGRRLIKPRSLSCMSLLFVYGIFSFLTGIFVATNKDYFVASMITFFAYAMVCYDICYISRKEGNMEWLLNILLLVAILCSIQTIFFGEVVRSSSEYVITMGVNNNPNSLGIVMVIGIFSALNSKNFDKYFYFFVSASSIFLYVIILTGSRKSLIAGLLLICFWIVIYLRNNVISKLNVKMLVRLIAIILVISVALIYFKNQFLETSAFIRFSRMFEGDAGNEERLSMYAQAVQMWMDNPIIGIGYDQFRIVSSSNRMTHSTYAEILVDTGVIGCCIWIYYMSKYFMNFRRDFRCITNSFYKYRMLMIILMCAIELFIAATQVFFFDFAHLVLLTFLFGANKYWIKGN